MDKLKMHSLDGVARNIERIGKLFPNAITEVMRGGRAEDEDDDGQDDQECDGRAGHCPRSARKVRSRVRWRSNISFFSCGSAWS